MAKDREAVRVVCRNRKARHEYELFDRYEAGIVLVGAEVKSLRDGRASLEDSFAKIRGDQIFLVGAHIQEYAKATVDAPDPKRPRKLLLHRREIAKLRTKVAERGFTVVPTSLYFKGPFAKVEIALAKGRKRFDKREKIREQEDRREMARAARRRR
jgi:SsrA-binding protein